MLLGEQLPSWTSLPWGLCSDPPWRTVPARPSLRTPAQNIWPRGSKSLRDDDRHTIRHKSARKRGLRGHPGGTTCPARHDTDQSIFGSGSLNLEAEVLKWAATWSGSLHRLWLGYWFLASSRVLSSGLNRRYVPFRDWLHEKPV